MDTKPSQFAELKLSRLPHNDQLQAWDSADTLLLEQLAEHRQLPADRWLLINDQFGALACALAAPASAIVSWSDSWLAHQAAEKNLAASQLQTGWQALPSTETPSGEFNHVLIKIPKTLALLEQQLHALRPLLTANSHIIAAGMAKHIHNSTLALFERIIGPSPTSLAKKKARLIFPTLAPELTLPANKSSSTWRENGLQISNLANVFARDKFDVGARFMIEQFAQLPSAENVVDLGCGNGVLAISAAKKLPTARFWLVDESYMAVASAKQNYQQNIADSRAEFVVGNCLQQIPALLPKLTSPDLILCNPPFHQQHAVGDQIAWQMLKESQQLLAKGGELWVVGNRHLHYHSKLKRLFGGCRTIASNNKFVVLAARKN